MSGNTDLITLNKYIEEVSRLLPYSRTEKQPVLDDLQDDLQEAVHSDPTQDLYTTFGSPREVARNLSKSHDWNIRPAGWIVRTLAFLVDFLILLVLAFTSIITGLVSLSNTINFDKVELFEFIILFSVLGFIGLSPVIIMFLYFVVSEKLWATTIGKWVFKLRTVDVSGIKPTWKQVIIRNFTKFQGEFLPFDIIIGMLMEKEKGTPGRYQRATDILVDTMVVRKA